MVLTETVSTHILYFCICICIFFVYICIFFPSLYSSPLSHSSPFYLPPSSLHQVEVYNHDELIYHGAVHVSFAVQMMAAAARIQREIPAIAWPFLLLQGDNDKLCDIGGARLMFEQAASADKKFKVRGERGGSPCWF